MKTKLKTTLCLSFVFLAGIFHVFGLSMSGQVWLTGNLVTESQKKGEDPRYDFFTLNPKNQVDKEALIIDFSDGSFGGRLGLCYWVNQDMNKEERNGGKDGSRVSFRRSNLWFKPFPELKITVGYVGNEQLYKERIDNWKVGNPFKYSDRNWEDRFGYSNFSDVDDMGIGIDFKPLDNLYLTAGIARRYGKSISDFGTAFWSKSGDGDPVYGAWGLTARYYPGHDISLQAAIRDNGNEDWKVIRTAIGYEANGIYAFVQPVFGIEWNDDDKKYELGGICFDLYGEYSIDSWTFLAHVPVTVRLTGRDGDPSYMEYTLQAKYNLGQIGNMVDFTPNLKFGTLVHDGDKQQAFIRFDEASDTMNFDVTPGIEFKVASCEVNIGFDMLFHSDWDLDKGEDAGHEKFEWRVPIAAKLKF